MFANQGGGVSQQFSNIQDIMAQPTTKSAYTNKKGMLYDDALLGTLYQAGFKDPQALAQAYAIARTESNGRPSAFNGNRDTNDKSLGIFQINMIDSLGPDRDAKFKKFVKGYNSEQDLFNPLVNARAAAYMSQKGGNWSSWGPDLTSKRYAEFLPETSAMQTWIGNQEKVNAGMQTISKPNSYFNSKQAANDGFVKPAKAKTYYSADYKVPNTYSGVDASGNNASNSGNISTDKSVSQQFAPVFSGASIKSRVF